MRRPLSVIVTATLATSLGTASYPQAAAPLGQGHVHATPSADSAPGPDGIRVDFELVDRDGRTVRDEDFRGRYLLLGFGFTHCTDVCPTMAFNMASALQTNATAAGVFVSVDTERDAPAAVDRYARGFHERLIGLSGAPEQVNAAARAFRVRYAVTKTEDSYTVQHTSHVYLIDPSGALAEAFSFSTPPAQIAAAMK